MKCRHVYEKCFVLTATPEVTKEVEKAPSAEETTVQEQTTIREQTTLIPNEAEAFALEPIDVTSLGK